MTWTQTRNNIISRAYVRSGVYRPNQAISNDDIQFASDVLNSILNDLQWEHKFPFKQEETIYALDTASSEVTGTDSNDYRCIRSHTSSTDDRPITGSNWEFYWTLDANASGSAWANSTAYTSIGDVTVGTDTVDILSVRIKRDEQETTLTSLTRTEYENIVRKGTESARPDSYFFERVSTTAGTVTPLLRIYPQSNQTDTIVIVRRIIEITEATSDATLDVPKSLFFSLEKLLTAEIIESPAYAIDDDLKAEKIRQQGLASLRRKMMILKKDRPIKIRRDY